MISMILGPMKTSEGYLPHKDLEKESNTSASLAWIRERNSTQALCGKGSSRRLVGECSVGWAGRFHVLPSICISWQIRAWDCLSLNAWREKALWDILLQTRLSVDTVRRARCDAHPHITNNKEHATRVSVTGKKQPPNIPHRFDNMSSAPVKGAWASTAIWASSSNPHKRHNKSKHLRDYTSQTISSNMFSQDMHDASEQDLNATNLFPVTKYFADASSQACHHCASNRYTCTRTIFASNEKFDDDEDHAY